MLSLSSLLNPVPQGPSNDDEFAPSPIFSPPTESCGEESFSPSRSTMPKHKMPKDAAVFTKAKTKGAINFGPYEDLDESSLRHTRIFEVFPLGRIREFSRHIPYNSGKKDFSEKTGRESFEVFQYVFKVPGDDTEYTVMWDYNVGLVRMTPFFKCCKYPKTTPAKMLNSNPGLKDITHSITGGSIMAQGYWMPYQCAKAVCATFCHNISGALIPIFGPDFPALCAQVDAPEYSRMVIDPAIVAHSTREAEYYRRLYSKAANVRPELKNDNRGNTSPIRERRESRASCDDHGKYQFRYCPRKPGASTPRSENSTYTTDTEGETSPRLSRTNLIRVPYQHPPHPRFPHSTMPPIIPPSRTGHASNGSSGWTPANMPHIPTHHRHSSEYQTNGPSPWLSAIPRFTTTSDLQVLPNPTVNAPKTTRFQPYPGAPPFNQNQAHPPAPHHHTSSTRGPLLPPLSVPPKHNFPPPSPRSKRPAAHIEEDRDHQYHTRQSQVARQYQANKESYADNGSICLPEDDKAGGADKKAALLLMNLSVREPSTWSTGTNPRENITEGSCEFDVGSSSSRYAGGNNGRYQSGVDDTGRDDADAAWRSRYNGGSDGMPALEGVPRMKRMRSSSM